MVNIQLRYLWRLVLVGVMLILSACSSMKHDGPPSFYVDETQVPDAVPKNEALSKYGNKPVYTVRGKRYHVLKTSKNYEEQGIASWYGTRFHAKRTSNGERYNMLAMTAAHKTLPLPTYVQVTNLDNGKKVIVKVNDRGPFLNNRLIDLSYVAAKKLGMLGHGTTHVDVKAIDYATFDPAQFNRVIHASDFYLASNRVILPHDSTPAPAAPPRRVYAKQVPHFSTHHPIYLQVGAFKNRNLAERQRKRLANMTGSPVKITRLAATHKRKLYRVQIGPLRDMATAQHLSQRLKAIGLASKRFQYRLEV